MRVFWAVLLIPTAACGGGGEDADSGTPPVVSVQTPAGTPSGLVSLSYSFTSADNNPISIQPEYSVNGGMSWLTATPGPGGDGVKNLAGGSPLTFVWNSVTDGVSGPTKLRITPVGSTGGASAETGDFTVDNGTLTPGGPVPGFPVQSNPTSGGDRASCVAVDQRHVYVFGMVDQSQAGDTRWRLEKRGAGDGVLAWSVEWNPGPGDDRPRAIAINATHLFLAGCQEVEPYGSEPRVERWRIEKRSLATGEIDPSFGGNGIILTGGTGEQGPMVLAVTGDFLFVGGREFVASPDDYRIRVEKRRTLDGDLVGDFGTGGVLLEDLSTGTEGVYSLLLVGDALFLGGTDSGLSLRVRIEKRSAIDGSFDPSFGISGVVTDDLSAGADGIWGLATDGVFLYAAAKVEGTGAYQAVLQKRNLSDGALVLSATSSGTIPTDEYEISFAADESHLYLAMADGASVTATVWRIEKRRLSDLSLDEGFGTGGVVTIDPAGSEPFGGERPDAIAVKNGVLYVVSEDHESGDGQWRLEALFK